MNLGSSRSNNIFSFSPMEFLHSLANEETFSNADKIHRAEMGQFFTPPSIALMMAEMFTDLPSSINLLDPGAGVGTLTAAFVARILNSSIKPTHLHVVAYEIDENLIPALTNTLLHCQSLCSQNRINFSFEIKNADFIQESVEVISGRNTLFSIKEQLFNVAILNPPYKKINSNSGIFRLLKSIGVDPTNLYSAFVWLVLLLLEQNGELVGIIPRSFCNGAYFRNFRIFLLNSSELQRIHLFESRTQAFKSGDVLQENIIIHARRKQGHARGMTTISSNYGPEDHDLKIREVSYKDLVIPDDKDYFIRIIPDQIGYEISSQINTLSTSLNELGLHISTGRVVDFRSKEFLRTNPDKTVIPLIYPNNIRNGHVKWPGDNGNKSKYLANLPGIEKLTVPSQVYVLVKRFSSKEEKRRVYAALYDPEKIVSQAVGIENHVNYFHTKYGSMDKDFAKGLVLYLNSSWVDEYFRQFSGHTQVNAGDLRNLKYPSASQLITLGKMIDDEFPSQELIDRMVGEVLQVNEKLDNDQFADPIQVRRRIKEALSILKNLNVPKGQQNDRSALTLLALTDMRPFMEWSEASQNLIGITEMMNFFRNYYGIDYAPNTRETVRKQTIHQFIQLGLVVANPDDPDRPINSPNTRYVIDASALDLIKQFGSGGWMTTLKGYLNSTPSMLSLQVRDRAIPMIPVTLPDGSQYQLTSGGQNELIKKIIEEFCPRYTPGGKVIYIGDAGKKLTETEIEYFQRLLSKFDKHGKMPDVIIELSEKKWLILIEAVTSHGPIDIKRHNELMALFGGGDYGLIFVTAFDTRRIMNKYLSQIAWETEVWVAEAPDHLIHFDGEKFLGPYS